MNLRRWHKWSRWALLIGLLVIALIGYCTSCTANAPRSIAQLEAMDDTAYANWLNRVSLWSSAAGYAAVEEGALTQAQIHDFATVVRLAVSDPTVSPDLSELATRSGISTPIALALLAEGQALIDSRGGWPSGERLIQVLTAIAQGVEAGAASVPAERPSK